MSWQANAWAMRKGRDYELQPISRFVLVTLSNYADPEGNDIYPSLSRLEADTGLSEATLRRHIKLLIRVGLLEYGDQSVVVNNPKIRADQRPKCYRFRMTDTGGSALDFGQIGVDPDKKRGVTERPRRVNGRSESTGTGYQTGCQADTQNNKQSEETAAPSTEDTAAPADAPKAQPSKATDPELTEAGRRFLEERAQRRSQQIAAGTFGLSMMSNRAGR